MKNDLDLIPLNNWQIFPDMQRPYLIAGPCSAESYEQLYSTAVELKKGGLSLLRAGVWKPRTSPDSFEGMGEEALEWLKEIKVKLDLKICTEVANAKHIESALNAGLDLLWIGARTSSNPFMMQDIADCLQGVDIPVLVKNPINQELALWEGALKRLNRAGIRKLGVIHRGFSTMEKIRYRNLPAWHIAIELKSKYPNIPIFADPSHIAGKRELIADLSQKALDLGFEGLMVESHISPSTALSDAQQQLTPGSLYSLLNTLIVRETGTKDLEYISNIDELRNQIDVIDSELLRILHSRMDISREIGRYKKKYNISIVQADRWENLLEKILIDGRKMDLSDKFLEKLFNIIHQESIDAQNDVLSKSEVD